MNETAVANFESQVKDTVLSLDKVAEQLHLSALEQNCLEGLPPHIEQVPWGVRRHWVEAFQQIKEAIIRAENKVDSPASFSSDATYDQLEQSQNLLAHASTQIRWLQERAQEIAYAANLAQNTSESSAQSLNESTQDFDSTAPRDIPGTILFEGDKDCDMDPTSKEQIMASIRRDIPILSVDQTEPSSPERRRFAELLAACGPFSNASVSATETHRIQNAITQPLSNDIHVLRYEREHPQDGVARTYPEKKPRDEWECDFCGELCLCKNLPNKDNQRGA